MATNIKITQEWTSTGDWYAALQCTLTNNSGSQLTNPVIKIQLGQSASASLNVGYNFEQSGDILTGVLVAALLPVSDGASVIFSIGLNYSNGEFDGTFPTAYWVDGVLVEGDGGSDGGDTEAPSVPTGLKSVGTSSASINLTWTASTDNVAVSYYKVFYSNGNQNLSVTSPATSCVLNGLSASTVYSIYVVAIDGAGNTSDNSDTIRVTTSDNQTDQPPSQPQNLQVGAVTDNSIALNWAPSTDDIGVSGYIVKYTDSGGTAKSVTTSSTSVTLTGLNASTQYSITVTAYDTANNQSQPSSILSVSTSGSGSSGAGGNTPYAPYLDVTTFANWGTIPPSINQDFVKDAIALGVKYFHLAFIVSEGTSKNILWGNGSFPLSSISPLVKIIQDGGAEAIFSFGGFSGRDPSVDLSSDELTSLYQSLNNTYGVTHLDFDFEAIGAYDYHNSFVSAKKALNTNPSLRFSLTLPVSPSGLNQEGLDMLTYAKSIELDVSVQIMAMDYGQGLSNMGSAAISAVNSTKDQLKVIYPDKTDSSLFNMIGVTPMLGLNDTAPEFFHLADVDTLCTFAANNGLSLVGAWSLGRDFPSGTDSHGNSHTELATCTQDPEQTESYQYSKRFLKNLNVTR
ncbi:MAG TPA: fibronectin type III domain-containing protein [Scandinavium sp.]|jgi:chitodextrinase